MGATYNHDWSGATFDRCVDLLNYIAMRTGMTYKQINVIVFCYIWPAVTLGLAIAVLIIAQKK